MPPRTAIKNPARMEWVPQAIIRKSVAHLSESHGLKFIEDSDNLDYFEGTAPSVIGNSLYVLRHYRGFPADAIGIYLPQSITDEKEIRQLIAQICEKLKLPRSLISWQRGMKG